MAKHSTHSREPFPSPCGTCWLVPLQRDGEYAKVCDVGLALVQGSRWSMTRYGYAAGWIDGRLMHMHRYLAACQPHDGMIVDHANQDRLDNRLENLRAFPSHSHPFQWASRAKRQSRFDRIGVHINRSGSFGWRITSNFRTVQRYGFKTPDAAALARDYYIREHGLPHTLNFPERFTDAVQDATAPAVNIPGPQQLQLF